MPSPASPPQPGICDRPPEGGDSEGRARGLAGNAASGLWGGPWGAEALRPPPHGPPSPGTFSVSDEEVLSERSHSPEGPHQASGPPALGEEACPAGDEARRRTACLSGWLSKQGRQGHL